MIRVTALTAALIVQYRVKGKRYNAGISDNQDHYDSAEATSYPFEQTTLAVGQSQDFDEVVAVRESSAPAPAPSLPESNS